MFKLIVENDMVVYTEKPGSNAFSSEKELAKLADSLELTRVDLESIWNKFTGNELFGELKPVKKFRNRPYGVKQIWKVIQRLVPAKRESKGTKSTMVVTLMKETNGASGEELMKVTGWKPHTVRGFISTLHSKHGLIIKSKREEGRGMVYRIA